MYAFSFTWPKEASSVMAGSKDIPLAAKDIEEMYDSECYVIQMQTLRRNGHPGVILNGQITSGSFAFWCRVAISILNRSIPNTHRTHKQERRSNTLSMLLARKMKKLWFKWSGWHPSSYHSFKSLCSSNLLQYLWLIWFPLRRTKFSETSR